MDTKLSRNMGLVDMGVKYKLPLTIPAKKVWEAMIQKIYHPEKVLPVNDAETTDIIPGKHVYRKMNFLGFIMKEDVYLDPENYQIRFVAIDDDAVHINKYHPDTGVIEYFHENKKGERITTPVPKTFAFNGMSKAKEMSERPMCKVH